MGPRVARGENMRKKNKQVQSKDILVVKDLRKEVHCSDADNSTDKMIKRTRECTKESLVLCQ
jgi:hypothetical protein